MNSTRRSLQWYDKTTEFAVANEDLKGISLKELQTLFGVPSIEPMYDCWEVKQEHLDVLQEHVVHEIDLSKYDYFVEASEGFNEAST